MNGPTMEDSPRIQQLKQKIAEKKRGVEAKQQEEEPEAEQVDFWKYMRQQEGKE